MIDLSILYFLVRHVVTLTNSRCKSIFFYGTFAHLLLCNLHFNLFLFEITHLSVCFFVDLGLIGPADSRRKDLSPKFNKQLEFWIISASVLIYFLVGRVRRRPLLSCPDGV